jgi:chemotaxis protein methyltransferase CheR
MNQMLRGNILEDIEIKTMRQLIAVVNDVYAVDLSDYALSSLKRRVLVAANKQKLTSVNVLIDKIEDDVDYFNDFLKEITVDVTEMFRDPSFWRLMSDQILKRFANHERIRIWVAGCSSGQEVYSLGIVLHELGILEKCTILATDLNQEILDQAQTGSYDRKPFESSTRNYTRADGQATLEEYFDLTEKTATIKPALLTNIKFAQHNLPGMKPMASQYDIILCRNRLIYFNHTLHEKTLMFLHTNLAKDGLLAIGSMEKLLGHAVSGKLVQLKDDINLFRKH